MALFAGPVPGGLWLGFSQGGVAYFKEGKVRESYAGVDGLGEGIVTSLSLDSDGTLWAATEVSGLTGNHAAPAHAEDNDFVQPGNLYRLMAEDEKDRVSHRGAAVRQLLAWLGR